MDHPHTFTINAGLSRAIPIAGALESRAVSTTSNAANQSVDTGNTTRRVATTWQQHEANVTAQLRAANPGVPVCEQITLDVTHHTAGQAVRIRIDNLYPDSATPAGAPVYQLVDAKFSSVQDLTTANLKNTVTNNQAKAYQWISSGQPVSVVPAGARAANFGLGVSINVAPSVEIHVNTATGTMVRPYRWQQGVVRE